MKKILYKALAALLCIGGVLGIGISLFLGFKGLQTHWIYLLLFSLFAAIYAWSVVTGMRLWKLDPRGLKWAKILFATQIPVFTAPGISYEWYTGLSMKVMGGSVEKNLFLNVGSAFSFYLDTRIVELAYGINLVALSALIFLVVTRPNSSFHTDP